jgi:hypothetical protein
MAVRPRGQVIERRLKSGRIYAIRFHVYGRRRYLTLGHESEGWTRRRAEDALANVLADVRRDLWVEPLPGARRRHRKEKREVLFAVGQLLVRPHVVGGSHLARVVREDQSFSQTGGELASASR